jgi:DNA-directed RNA polymerase subunit N (RpoN/RPB10)
MTMPTCPKCGKMISAQRYSRHLQRCGQTHKNKSKVLDHPDNFFMKI